MSFFRYGTVYWVEMANLSHTHIPGSMNSSPHLVLGLIRDRVSMGTTVLLLTKPSKTLLIERANLQEGLLVSPKYEVCVHLSVFL